MSTAGLQERIIESSSLMWLILLAIAAETVLRDDGRPNAAPTLEDYDTSSIKSLVDWCYTCRLEVPAPAVMACQKLLDEWDMPSLAQEFAGAASQLEGEALSGLYPTSKFLSHILLATRGSL